MRRQLLRRGGLLSLAASIGLLVALVSFGITSEIALGSLQGRVVMFESGLPLKRATVTIVAAEQIEGLRQTRVVTTDARGNFSVSNLQAGDYTVQASAKAHSLEPLLVTVAEGEPTPIELALRPHQPRLAIHTSQRVFMPGEDPEIEAHGFGPEDRLTLAVYRLNLDAIVSKTSVQALLWALNYESSGYVTPEAVGTLVTRFEHKIENRDAEGTFIDVVKLPKLSEGFYWINSSLGSRRKAAFLMVSKIGLVTKSAPGHTLCYVADLQTGDPVVGARIETVRDGNLSAVGITNSEGIASFVPAAGVERSMVMATVGASRAITSFYQSRERAPSPLTIFAYTDRPVYRPGDEVAFKGFLRKATSGGYALSGAGSGSGEVYDGQGNLIKTLDFPVASNGAFNSSFETSKEAEPGEYRVEIKALGESHTLPVSIASYRKPEYTVKVTWSRPFYPVGDKAHATVRCEYYLGGPVVGAKVTASVMRQPDWGYGSEYFEYDPEFADAGELVHQAEGTTDSRGEARISFDTRESKSADRFPTDYWYTLVANVADAGDKYFSGEGRVRVTRGEFGLTLETDRYVLAHGETTQVTVKAVRHEDGRPLPGQQVNVVAGTETWVGNEAVFRARRQYAVTTGPDGTGRLAIAAEADALTIKAIATDSRRSEITAEAYVWVHGSAHRGPKAGKIDVVLDKRSYQRGETAKALISTDKVGGAALLTIEAAGVVHRQVVRLTGPTTTIALPVRAGYEPQVTVAVARIREKNFQEATAKLRLDLKPRELRIEVQPDKAMYLPGESATYTVRTSDARGAPVSADVSVAVVDESVYAIRQDKTDPLSAFYGDRPNEVQTNYSFPELYLDGGDKGGAIAVRRDFRDRAAWVPSIRTGADGLGTAVVRLPENLTTWRATALGVSDTTEVGIAKSFAVVSKPLMIRLQGPRVMTQKDEQEIAAVVTNASGKDLTVRVRLDQSAFQLQGDREEVLRLDDGETQPVRWRLTSVVSGEARLVARVWAENGPSDGVEQRVMVLPHGRDVVKRDAGEIRDSHVLRVALRPDADQSVGGLVLSFSPTIASTLYQSLDELIGFPYGCVEQTMSRFLPAAVFASSLNAVSTRRPELVAKVPEIVADGVSRLQRMQHGDGGWGWWENDQSDPYMTAYVLDGFHRAKAAGFEVSPFLADRGLSWAIQRVNSETLKNDSLRVRAYLAYVLAKHGKRDEAVKAMAGTESMSATPLGAAAAALAFGAIGDAARQEWFLRQLRSSVDEGAAMASWPEEPEGWGAETTAWAVLALQSASGPEPLVPKAVRYLLARRRGDMWDSTRDSTFAIIALSGYIRSTGELGGKASSLTVHVNGMEEARVRLDPQDPGAVQPRIEIPVRRLKRGINLIEMRLEGAPVAYYSSVLRQVAAADRIGRVLSGGGFDIERRYYVLQPQRTEDGNLRLLPSNRPITRARSGDLIRCELTITSNATREYVIIEDPTPSNCRPTEREGVAESEDWQWWWSSTVVMDGKVAVFARHIPSGTHKITYMMRAEAPGKSHALPPLAMNMYDPDDQASSAESELEVRR